MFHTVYRIIDTTNNKTYIGKHQTKDLDDGYMGSGKLIKRAIKKRGLENFTKEILHVFDTEEEMNLKEKELVVIGESSYNLCPGGRGGFGYINRSGKKPWARRFTQEDIERGILRSKELFSGRTLSEEYRRKISDSMRGNKNTKGHKLSEDHKRKIGASLMGNKNKRRKYN